MNADGDVMRFFEAPLSREQSDEAIDRYNMQMVRDGFTMFAAEERETGALAGVLGMQTMRYEIPNLPQPAVEIGWRLGHHAQGRGLATEGARRVIDHAFTTVGLSEVVAITVEANTASRNVMRKLGMTHRPELTFDHPKIALGHAHRLHILYSLSAHNQLSIN